jgi:HEAT repeat protein
MTTWCALGVLLLSAAAPLLRGSAATDQRCTEMLQKALDARNPDVRKQAVVALSLASLKGSFFNRLVAMLQDKDVEVRQTAIASLTEVKNAAALAALRKALEDDVPEVSFDAAKALWSLRDPAGRTALLAVLEKESKTASGFFTKQKRDALRMMHTPRATFLFAVRQGVGFAPVAGLGEGIASMQGILMDPGVSGRATAALLLGADRTPATLQALRDALQDSDAGVRAAAVHSLALRNTPSLASVLEPMLDDDKEPVRLRAAAALLRLSAIRGARPAAKKQPSPQL